MPNHYQKYKEQIKAKALLTYYKYKKSGDYPPPVFTKNAIPMRIEETEKFVRDSVSVWKKVKDLPDDDLPECPVDELWIDKKDGFTRKRCEDYCGVNMFCNQYQKYKEEKLKRSIENITNKNDSLMTKVGKK